MKLALTLAAAAAAAEPGVFAPGEISTGSFDSHPTFTADDVTLYFVRSTPSFGFWTIVESHLQRNGHWTTPEVAPFSGTDSDADPFITANGQQLYFISRRASAGGQAGDLDIWVMDRAGSGWSAPRNVAAVNSPGDEWYPTLGSDGYLYFGSDRTGGRGLTDLYRAKVEGGSFGPVESLGDAINTGADDYEPYLSPDGRRLYFMSCGRKDSLGGCDIYASPRSGTEWSAPVNLGPQINSPRQEYSPSMSRDGRRFLWTSCRALNDAAGPRMDRAALERRINGPGNGLGDIYEIAIEAIDAIVAQAKGR